MAEGCTSGDHPDGVKVWTFILRGGNPFRLSFTGKLGPPLDHDGRLTVWKMVGTGAEAASVENMVVTVVGATVTRHTEEEDEEMLALRHHGEG